MKCTACNSEVLAENGICEKCGATVSNDVNKTKKNEMGNLDDVEHVALNKGNSSVPAVEQEKSHGWLWAIVILIVIVVGATYVFGITALPILRRR